MSIESAVLTIEDKSLPIGVWNIFYIKLFEFHSLLEHMDWMCISAQLHIESPRDLCVRGLYALNSKIFFVLRSATWGKEKEGFSNFLRKLLFVPYTYSFWTFLCVQQA